jgi:hypothetical protein
MSVSARHETVLTNGGRGLLLADRGWSASGPPNIWAVTSVEERADTARMVVGPDEPFGGRSQENIEADHWASLAAVLRHQGVDVDALELGRLPHDVVLGEQLLARIAISRATASSPDAAARVCVGRRTRIAQLAYVPQRTADGAQSISCQVGQGGRSRRGTPGRGDPSSGSGRRRRGGAARPASRGFPLDRPCRTGLRPGRVHPSEHRGSDGVAITDASHDRDRDRGRYGCSGPW